MVSENRLGVNFFNQYPGCLFRLAGTMLVAMGTRLPSLSTTVFTTWVFNWIYKKMKKKEKSREEIGVMLRKIAKKYPGLLDLTHEQADGIIEMIQPLIDEIERLRGEVEA